MDGTVLPLRPVYPLPSPSTKPVPIPPWKCPPKAPSPPPQKSQSSLPIESLLQHLTAPSLSPRRHPKPRPLDLIDDGVAEFLTTKGRMMFNSIAELPLEELPSLFESSKADLLDLDLVSLLKALDLSGKWGKSLALFEWVASQEEEVRLSSHMVELVVRMLGRESQHGVASRLFDRLRVERFSLDVRAYTTVIHAYSRTGKFHRALAVFSAMRDSGLSPTLVTFNVVLDVYGRMGGCWDRMVALVDEIRRTGLDMDDFTCSTVISACAREGLLEEAREFFAGLDPARVGTVTYNALIQAYGKAGAVAEAVAVADQMRKLSVPMDTFTYNELVGAYVRAGLFDEAAAVLDSMTGAEARPNAVTYTTLIDAYGKAGREDDALRLVARMKNSGCVPNACTFNALLGMLGKKRRLADMTHLLRDMASAGVAPNRATWNAVLAVCGHSGHLTRILAEMRRCGFDPDRHTYNTLIGAYGRWGPRSEAERARAEMLRSGFRPCVATYNALLSAAAHRGDWRWAQSILEEMAGEGVRGNDSSQSLVLQCHARGGNLGGIRRMEEEEIYLEGRRVGWVVLRTLVLVNFKCRCLSGMVRAVEEMGRQGYKPDLVVFNSLLSMYARNSMAERANETLAGMREAGLRPDLVTFNTLIDMEARRGACWKAEEILRGLQASGLNPDLVSYNIVIKGFCKQGLMEEAVRTLEDMARNGISPCIFTYNTFVTGYANKAMFHDALNLIDYMAAHGCPPNHLTYKILLDSLCRAHRYEQAAQLLHDVRGLNPQAIHSLSARLHNHMER